jgi:hypothetical protein
VGARKSDNFAGIEIEKGLPDGWATNEYMP